jgi:exodeoxyribonuclease VIII
MTYDLIPYAELTLDKAKKGCFVADMPNEAYHAYDGISKSGLDKISRSPAHYKCGFRKESPAMKIGTDLHCAILEPLRFAAEYHHAEGCNNKALKAFKDVANAHPTKNTLKDDEWFNVMGVKDSIFAEPEARNLLTGDGCNEISAFATDPVTGVLVRARFDRIQGNAIVDLKKTRDARSYQFASAAAMYRYHVQDAFYKHVFKLVTGEDATFNMIVFEDAPPHPVMVYELDEGAVEIGKAKFMEDLVMYADCVASGAFPAYPEPRQILSLPAWKYGEIEDLMEIPCD